MQRVTLAIIMGLGEDPSKACLGLRDIAQDLANEYPLDLVFASYKASDDQIDAMLSPFDSPIRPTILTGHSLGGGQAHAAAMRRVQRGLRVDALGLWEPVPEDDAFNGNYRFAAVPGVANQICMRVAGNFPIAWGRRFADDSLNVDLPRRSFGMIAVDHAAMCQWPEVREWYSGTVKALCEFQAPPTALPSRGLTIGAKPTRKRKSKPAKAPKTKPKRKKKS
jgi:pimeloyl-ACP methyl ester carboxylesterase